MTEYRRQLGEPRTTTSSLSSTILHSPLKKQRQVDTITERILANSKLLYKLVSALIQGVSEKSRHSWETKTLATLGTSYSETLNFGSKEYS